MEERMHRNWLCGVAGVLMGAGTAMATSPNQFLQWDLDIGNNGSIEMHGLLYVPSTYDPSKTYSLVTYLHGSGHAATSGIDVHGSSNQTDTMLARAESMGFFLFLPQAPTNAWNTTYTGRAVTLIDRITTTYNVDPNRLYITGGSMGGGGVYTMVSSNPGKFAAAVPMAGINPGGLDYSVLAQTPMWIHHSQMDGTVSMTVSRNHVNDIRNAKGLPDLSFPLPSGAPLYADSFARYHKDPDGMLQYTEYQWYGHVIWPDVMNDQKVYDWMFAQVLPEPGVMGALGMMGVTAGLRRGRRRQDGD
jgi:predicted peptidase